MKPILSIIVPCHNAVETLPELLDSILEQTFNDLEVIVVDDASNQPYDAVVSAYKNKGLNTRLVRHAVRQYTYQSRITGLNAAQGRIISFADADDILWGTEAMERHVAQFVREEADILHFRFILTDCKRNVTLYNIDTGPLASSLSGNDIFDKFSQHNMYFSSSNCDKYYSKELCIKAAGVNFAYTPKQFCEDTYLNSLLFFHARKYVGSLEAGYAYAFRGSAYIDQAHLRFPVLYRLIQVLVPYFREQGCPEKVVQQYVSSLTKWLVSLAGNACAKILEADALLLGEAELEKILPEDELKPAFWRAIALSNGINARKLKTINATLTSAIGK